MTLFFRYINHNLYWSTISPNLQGEHRLPSGKIEKDIMKKFGSFSEFKSTFTDMANNYFGSGIDFISEFFMYLFCVLHLYLFLLHIYIIWYIIR